MSPLRGWSLRGRRLEAKVPFGHWKTMTFIGALRHDRIDAPPPAIPRCFASREPWQASPWVIDGPVNADVFQRYVETQLIPTLSKGDIVILDNLSSHKAPAIRAAIRPVGARLLFLPAYSPDLNPIERLRQTEALIAQSLQIISSTQATFQPEDIRL